MIQYIRRFWKENIVVVTLLFITGVCQTIVSVRTANALDYLIVQDFDNFLTIMVQILTIFIVYLFFTRLQIIKISETKQKMATAIRRDITERIERTGYNHFHERQVGTYVSWLSNDIATIETEAFTNLYHMMTGVIGAFTSIIALFFFHWSLGIWTLFIGGVTILLPKIYQKQLGKATLKTTNENETFISTASEFLAGYDTLFSYSLLKIITEKIEAGSNQLADAKNNQASVVAKVTILAIFGNILGQLSVATLTGFLAWREIIAIGAFAATSNLAITIFNTFGNVSNQLAAIRSVQPIFEKFETIEEIDEATKVDLNASTQNIQIQNMAYAYGDKTVLKNISYTFQAGKKYAIVGASGSGKTTLLNILNGKLTNYFGSVTFAETELSDMPGEQLRENILYIDQSPYLFSGTIRENITLGETFSEEEINQVIHEASLEDIIETLPEGIDSPVGEAGRSLSGGQRQRIALARGLIRGKKIILIDEGTSSLDETSALKIEEHLIDHPSLTVIMITHHLRQEIKKKLDGLLELT